MSLTETKELTIKLVQDAGLILKRHFELKDFSDKSKGGVDFVTQADEEVDQFLLKRLKNLFPNDKFLTEETAPEDYSYLSKVNNLWVIDPLDGTTRFSRGYKNFAISIGLADKSVTKLAIIHLPITGETLWAQEDQHGAFLNDQRVTVSSTSELRKTVIATDWLHDLDKRDITVDWQRNLCKHVRSIWISGSAVSAMSDLALANLDAFLCPDLKPWDVAAAAFLIQKAGGKITRSDGSHWNIFDKDIFASNCLLHNLIIESINQ